MYRHPTLGWEGIDAVVDKDLVAAVLARDLGAGLLLDSHRRRRGLRRVGNAPSSVPWRSSRSTRRRQWIAQEAFGEGSMAPKIRAAIDFVRRTEAARFGPNARARSSRRSRAGGTRCTAMQERRSRHDRHDAYGERVNIHEYQAKDLLRGEGVPIPPGEVATTPAEAEAIARKIRRHGRGEGAGARRRSRQGGRREAREDAGGGARDRGQDPRHADQGAHGRSKVLVTAGRRHRDARRTSASSSTARRRSRCSW